MNILTHAQVQSALAQPTKTKRALTPLVCEHGRYVRTVEQGRTVCRCTCGHAWSEFQLTPARQRR